MQKNRIHKYLAWLLVFALVCSSVFVTTRNAEAAGKKNIKSVTVKVDGKNSAKKGYTPQRKENDIGSFCFSPQGRGTCYLHIK